MKGSIKCDNKMHALNFDPLHVHEEHETRLALILALCPSSRISTQIRSGHQSSTNLEVGSHIYVMTPGTGLTPTPKKDMTSNNSEAELPFLEALFGDGGIEILPGPQPVSLPAKAPGSERRRGQLRRPPGRRPKRGH